MISLMYFSCLFYFFMFVDAFTIVITVLWVYARWNINFALHLRQFVPYGHFHPFSCLNCSRLIKGLNNYNNVTEWDNWFVCVAVETCEKKTFDLYLVPDIFLPYFFGAWYFSTEMQLMRLFLFLFFFRHFFFGKVSLLPFNTILNILFGFQRTCNYMYQWVWA